MMDKIPERQLYWLRWLDAQGGRGTPNGARIEAGAQRSGSGAPVSFMHLCARGAITGQRGELVVTRTGRALLGLSEPPPGVVDAIRERDANCAPTWFTGPAASGPAQAYRDRRTLLDELDRRPPCATCGKRDGLIVPGSARIVVEALAVACPECGAPT